ncbi:MAG: DUF695 domain-containing protein [Steroidobacteraceae bacterium]
MDEDPWFLSEGKIGERLALIRGREMLPPEVRPETHPNLLNIVWDYEGDPVNGMPSSAESQEMAEFEELIVPALEKDHACALFAVETYDSQRYWRFYCRDLETTQQLLWGALGTEGDLPIDLQMDDDPEWDVLSQIIAETDRAH